MNYLILDPKTIKPKEKTEVSFVYVNDALDVVDKGLISISLVDDKSIDDFKGLIAKETTTIVMYPEPVFLFDLAYILNSKEVDFAYLDLAALFARTCAKPHRIQRCLAFFDKEYQFDNHDRIDNIFNLFRFFRQRTWVNVNDLSSERFECCFKTLSAGLRRWQAKVVYEENVQSARESLDLNKIEKFVFFDLEAANERNNIAKICEFGAVVTDKNFNVLEKINYVINPEDEFCLGGSDGREGLELYYSERFYLSQKPFPDFYDRIKAILEDKKSLVMGYAVDNDVKMIATDSWSYELPQLDYLAFDIQQFLFKMEPNNGNLIGLGKAADAFLTIDDRNGIYEHRSVDDAMLTMLVAKNMLKEYGFTLQKAIEETENGIVVSKGLLEVISADMSEKPITKIGGYLK